MEKNETDREIPAKVNANLIYGYTTVKINPNQAGWFKPHTPPFTIDEKISRITGLKRIAITPPSHEKIESGT